MANVALPSGEIVQFPDDMPATQINSAIEGHLAASQPPDQMTGAMRLPAMAASNLAKGVIEAPGILSAPFRLYDKYLGAPVANAVRGMTGQPQDFKGYFSTPGSPVYMAGPEDFNRLGHSAGITDRSDLTPQTTGERYLAAGAHGAGQALPFAAFGGVPGLVPRAVTAAASGVGAGSGVEAGNDVGELYPKTWPLAPVVKAAAPIVGGLAGGFGASGLANVGARATNAVVAPSETVQAYNRLNIDPALAGDVTGNRTLQGIQGFTAMAPAGGKVRSAMDRVIGQWGNALDRIASRYGDSGTLQEAGTALQAEGKNWLNRFKSDSGKTWNAVDEVIPASTPVSVANYEATLSNIGKTMPDAQATAKVLQPGLSRSLYAGLQADLKAAGAGPSLTRGGDTAVELGYGSEPSWVPSASDRAASAAARIGEGGPASWQEAAIPAAQNTGVPAIPAGQALTWQSVKGIRSRIGEMLSDPNLPADAGMSELKRLYGALTADMNATVQSAGPQAQAAFQRAVDTTKNGHAFIDGVLAPIVRQGVSPETAASSVLNSGRIGATRLQAIRDQMPTAADELAAAFLRKAGSGAAGGTTQYSPVAFDTAMHPRNLSPEARGALFGEDPDIAALAMTGRSMKTTAKIMANSQTAPNLQAREIVDVGRNAVGGALAGGGAGTLIAGPIGGAIGGTAGALLGPLMPFAPGYLGGQLTATPWLTKFMAGRPLPASPIPAGSIMQQMAPLALAPRR